MSDIDERDAVDALAVVLCALDSDVAQLDRVQAKTIARHVVRSDWLASYVRESGR